MKCPKCDCELPENAGFCFRCGAALKDEKADDEPRREKDFSASDATKKNESPKELLKDNMNKGIRGISDRFGKKGIIIAAAVFLGVISLISCFFGKPKVSVPSKNDTLVWPDSILAALVPRPDSDIGNIEENSADKFTAVVGGMSFEDYRAYVDKCVEHGFNEKQVKGGNNFSAKDANGYRVEVVYTEKDIVTVSVYDITFDVSVYVKCEANMVFSRYDVKVYVDGEFVGRLDHGASDTYNMTLKSGEHKLKVICETDTQIIGEARFNVEKDASFEYSLYCTSYEINVNELTGSSETTLPEETNATEEEETDTSEEEETTDADDESVTGADETGADAPEDDIESTSAPETTTRANTDTGKSVYYSTNTSETVKKGSSGVYAYRNKKGSNYDIYYIINFNEGCVYYFCDGNGSTTCDRAVIESGTLNDVMVILYDFDYGSYEEGLHFKWKNQPENMIVQLENGSEYEFVATNLADALAVKSTKSLTN